MPDFGSVSRARLATCDVRLQRLMYSVVEDFDCSILKGHRDQQEQDEAFRTGASQLRWPNGKHNAMPSMAVDIAPYPIDFSNRPKAIARFYLLAGVVLTRAIELRIPIRWGGDWDGDLDIFDQTFDDLGHFEIKGVN